MANANDGNKPTAKDEGGQNPTSEPNTEGGSEGVDNQGQSASMEDSAEDGTLFDRAIRGFDRTETRPQLAEHYQFRDEEFEQHGRF